jgi:hypothetical protein
VREAVKASLAGAATEGAAAVQAATQPLLGRLASVTQDAGRAEAAMRKVVLWASWRLLSWVMAAAAGSVLLGWFASTAVLWWDTGAIADAQVRKAQLEVQVAEMQANYDSWVKAGMLGKIIRCPGNRPKVPERSKARGTTTTASFRDIRDTIRSGAGWNCGGDVPAGPWSAGTAGSAMGDWRICGMVGGVLLWLMLVTLLPWAWETGWRRYRLAGAGLGRPGRR